MCAPCVEHAGEGQKYGRCSPYGQDRCARFALAPENYEARTDEADDEEHTGYEEQQKQKREGCHAIVV